MANFFCCAILLFVAAKTFGATLDESFSAALTKQESIHQSRERVGQAQERVNQLRGAIFPNVALNASHMIQPQASDPIAAEFFPENQTTVNLALSQPLFRGLREFAGLRQQKDLAEAQEQSHRETVLRLYEDVAGNYLSILAAERDLKNLGEQAEIYDKRAGELRGRARTGESHTTEVLTAQSTLASLRAEIRLVESQLQGARENFHFLTGLPRDTVLVDPALLGKSGSLEPLASWLSNLEKRPDFKEARSRFQAAEEDVSIAKGAHWPTMDLLGNYYLVRPEGFMEDLKWDVTLRLSLPLFEGGATQARVREAASRRLEADLQLSRLRRLAEQQIRTLHESVKARVDQIQALETSVDLAARNGQVIQRDYRRGLVRNIDVQLALTELRVARRSLDQARFLAQLDLIRLRLASARPPAVLEGVYK